MWLKQKRFTGTVNTLKDAKPLESAVPVYFWAAEHMPQCYMSNTQNRAKGREGVLHHKSGFSPIQLTSCLGKTKAGYLHFIWWMESSELFQALPFSYTLFEHNFLFTFLNYRLRKALRTKSSLFFFFFFWLKQWVVISCLINASLQSSLSSDMLQFLCLWDVPFSVDLYWGLKKRTEPKQTHSAWWPYLELQSRIPGLISETWGSVHSWLLQQVDPNP